MFRTLILFGFRHENKVMEIHPLFRQTERVSLVIPKILTQLGHTSFVQVWISIENGLGQMGLKNRVA